jgi:hypothetical protein
MLLFVSAYFAVLTLMLRRPIASEVSVPSYEPPASVSPGVAAWLLEPGQLSRAIAAALVNMAAKGYVKIENKNDLFSVTQLATDCAQPLEPEEDALVRCLFESYDFFGSEETTPATPNAVGAFRDAIEDTQYLSSHVGVFVPAWLISALAIISALVRGIMERILMEPSANGLPRGLSRLCAASLQPLGH